MVLLMARSSGPRGWRAPFRDRWGVSTPSGTSSTTTASMRMPASSARSCSSRSRISSGDGGRLDEALQGLAAIGVEADVVVERPLARRAPWRG